MEKKGILIKSSEKLTKAAKKYWQFFPEDFQKIMHEHIKIINKIYSEITINKDYLPDVWQKNTDVQKALKNYLTHLKKSFGREITPEVVKACINDIYRKTKDDTDLAINSYNYSVTRNYAQPYVPNKTVTQLIGIDGLPQEKEVREAFESYFKGQNITDNLINFFMNFNKWLQDNLHKVIAGKDLYKFIKELAKLTDLAPGKVFSTLKYLAATKSIVLPPDYSPILNWSKKQNK